ncbi:MAG: DUF4193 family protein [Actinomycetota bacterium]|nr:DUF4193 family protein [Actinomycetota bacterium]
MEEIEENVDESLEDDDLDGLEDEAEEEAPAPAAAAAREPDEGEVESSLEELLAKREGTPAEEEEDDDSILALGREERLEPLAVKVVPPSDKEFVCRNCHLVKHRAQLADRDRMFCRDCA